MGWFDDAVDGSRPAPLPEQQRGRRVLVAWLVLGGVLIGLLVAGAASAVAQFVDQQNATGPGGPAGTVAIAALAEA